ncbi:MAG: flippase [Ruminococcaceae bacterium]|nr:flippase [Oscillospiraceae bacterium]
MPTGSIKKNYIYNVSFQIFSLIIPFLTAPYIARVLGAEGEGTYVYVNSIATFFSLVAALGISSYGTREVSRAREDKHLASRLFWELSIIRLVSTLLCLIPYILYCLNRREDAAVAVACGITILSVGVDCTWFFQAMERFRTLMLRNFAVKAISVILIFLLVNDRDDLLLYALIQGGGILLSNLVLTGGLLRQLTFIPLRRLRFRRHLRGTLVYFVPVIATSVYTVLDRAMLGLITQDMAANGYYERAHKIINIVMTVITSLNVVVGVRTSYLFAQHKTQEIRHHIYDTFRFMYMIAFPMAAGLCACAANFVPWFYGEGSEQVVPLLILFSPLLFIIGTSNVLGSLLLTPGGKRGRSNRAILTGAVLNLILNLILIPLFGVYGAVVASLAAETVISVLYLRFSCRFISVYRILYTGLRYLVLAAVMFVPTYLLGRGMEVGVGTTLLQILTGVIIYSLCLILTNDPAWQTMRKAIARKLGKGR